MPFTEIAAVPVKQQVLDGSSMSVVLPQKSPVGLLLVSFSWIRCFHIPERREMPTEGLQLWPVGQSRGAAAAMPGAVGRGGREEGGWVRKQR